MRVLWISPLPQVVQQLAFGGERPGAHPVPWIVSHLPPPADVELHVACLVPGSSERRDVDVLGVRFHLLPCPSRGRALLLFQRDHSYFAALVGELRPDVIHGWGTEDSYGLVARQLAPRHHVIGIQGLISVFRARASMPLRTRITELTERWTLRRARWVVAESTYALEAARPYCPSATMRVIDHPVRREFLDAEPADGRARRIVFLGRLDERKGIRDALTAFAALEDPRWSLHVIGSGTAEEERAVHARIAQLGIATRVQHDRDLVAAEVVRAMQASSVLLLPTRADTGPTALKEALVMGLWPVCYDNTGPGEYVRKFAFGSLARDLDPTHLARTLRDAIAAEPWCEPSRRDGLKHQTRIELARDQIWSALRRVYEDVHRSATTVRSGSR